MAKTFPDRRGKGKLLTPVVSICEFVNNIKESKTDWKVRLQMDSLSCSCYNDPTASLEKMFLIFLNVAEPGFFENEEMVSG